MQNLLLIFFLLGEVTAFLPRISPGGVPTTRLIEAPETKLGVMDRATTKIRNLGDNKLSAYRQKLFNLEKQFQPPDDGEDENDFGGGDEPLTYYMNIMVTATTEPQHLKEADKQLQEGNYQDGAKLLALQIAKEDMIPLDLHDNLIKSLPGKYTDDGLTVTVSKHLAMTNLLVMKVVVNKIAEDQLQEGVNIKGLLSKRFTESVAKFWPDIRTDTRYQGRVTTFEATEQLEFSKHLTSALMELRIFGKLKW